MLRDRRLGLPHARPEFLRCRAPRSATLLAVGILHDNFVASEGEHVAARHLDPMAVAVCTDENPFGHAAIPRYQVATIVPLCVGNHFPGRHEAPSNRVTAGVSGSAEDMKTQSSVMKDISPSMSWRFQHAQNASRSSMVIAPRSLPGAVDLATTFVDPRHAVNRKPPALSPARTKARGPEDHDGLGLRRRAGQAQPSSLSASPAFQIFVICAIFPLSNCITYT